MIAWLDGETKRFCLTKDKEYFVKELDSLEGDRNAFIAQKTEQRKARKKVRTHLQVRSELTCRM